ncbi:MAG: putative trypsin-like serine protease [Nocardioidaceae bacterium]|nr:putative trypsin-like serine protease [Nocardioidaceae bacterium]
MRRVQVGMAVAAGMLVAAIPSQATAIQDGQVAEPDQFTNVAVLRFLDTDTNTRWRCSGTLVAPDVIITAAHCTEAADTVYYSFAPVRPTAEPDAPGDTGWTLGGSNLDAEQSIFTDPDWDGDLQMQSLDDIGVIVLDSAVTGIEPATIAPLGTLEGLPRGTLFTLAGYGIHYVKPTEGPRKPTAVAGLERSWTTSPLSALTSDTLMLAASPEDKRGGGTICSGDSGGPVFYDGLLVAVTSWGSSIFCRSGQGGFQRLDTADAFEFYGPLVG